MDKFIEKLETKLVPIASKLGNQKHLLAIRDAFIVIMPLMIIGAFAVAINNMPIPAFQSFMDKVFPFMNGDQPIWKNLGGNIWSGSFAIISLFMSFLVAYNLSNAYNMNGLIGGATSMASFCAIGGLTGADAMGLIFALLISLLSVELLRFLSGKKWLRITMPEGVPPGVADSFTNMLPMMITVFIFSLANTLLIRIGIENVVLAFYEAFQEPFMNLTNSLPSAIIIAVIPPLLWFFGLHGANMIEPFMQSINVTAIDANIKAIQAGNSAPYIVSKPFFDAFVNLGGTGATIALIIAIFLVVRKNQQFRKVAEFSVAPGLFNINEPMTFGLPIVLNPILFIPYILAPVVLTIIAYVTTSIGLVPACTFVLPWVTPPVIGGFLATQSVAGAILAAVNVAVAVLIYLPFVKLADKHANI